MSHDTQLGLTPPAGFAETQRRLAPHFLLLFQGKWAAWHPDGTHVFAVADGVEELVTRLANLGIPVDRVVIERIAGEPLPPGYWPDLPIDFKVFHENQRRVTPDYLVPFWGQQVAWHADGSPIVAAADSHEGLQDRLRELGIDPYTVVYDFIDDPNIARF